MRYFLLVTLITLVTCSCAATITGPKAPVEMRTYSEVIEVPNKSKDELYVSANEWFVKNFNSAESVIEFQDKESGKILGKYVFSYSEDIHYYNVKQNISVDVKDGRVRVTIDDPYYMATGDSFNGSYRNTSYSPLVSQAGIDRSREEWSLLCKSISNFLKTDSSW